MTKPIDIHKWIEKNHNSPAGIMVKANLEASISSLQEMVNEHIKVPVTIAVYPQKK